MGRRLLRKNLRTSLSPGSSGCVVAISLGIRRPPGAGGFTLLELVLALGLMVVVLGAIALSVDLHLRVAQLGRQRVEEAQLARVILQRIADDIRGALPPQSVDVETLSKTLAGLLEGVESLNLEDLAAGLDESSGTSSRQTSGSGTSSSASSGQASRSGTSSSTSAGTATEESSESEEEETTETILGVPRSVPGLYGGPDWLQVDVSRLPRPDQYHSYAWTQGRQESWQLNRLSEVKTVLYGLMLPGSTMSMSHTIITAEEWGLYRDEVDRAMGAFASQHNVLDQKVRSAGPLAPEVVWLEFWYFDGSQWYDSWDSDVQGGLPVAVEVIIGLDMSRSQQSAQRDQLEYTPAEPRVLYRTVVYLPVARPATTASSS